MKNFTLLFSMMLLMNTFINATPSNKYIDESVVNKTTQDLSKQTNISAALIIRGVQQTADFWTNADGTKDEFNEFCIQNFCKSKVEKEKLFYRICDNFESIFGHNNRVTIDLLLPLHVTGYEKMPVDDIFGAYNGLSHFNDDMFENKIAFIIILNFPSFTLEEKNKNGAGWSELEWGYVRLGDVFASRVPARQQQIINNALSAADNYISNYNIYMGKVWSDQNEVFWPADLKLISHWGLRDELKACYSDNKNGLKKQTIIYNIMKRIVDQSIPEDVVNNDEYIWYPSTNQVFYNNIEINGPSENNVRYQQLLNNFKAIKASDEYYGKNSDYISRKFNTEYEISLQETQRLFNELLSSPQVKEVAKLISQRLGRKLQPFDIWYDGFKSRSLISSDELDRITKTKYPNKTAFTNDLPNILIKMGFTKELAKFICDHVTVDASVGAGHAWESMMKSDNARLRTRIENDGMYYKGYNIGVHEFGHNVEQTISLHYVPNYFLRGVPNTAFTEALAFTFQSRDLELLGVSNPDEYSKYMNTLDIFWGCYEIMGVSMVDMKVWQWMYQHPDATAAQLKNAVISIAKEVWNQYFEPVFNSKDQPILAVYSHMIDAPLYLSAYPIGHLIDFQLESYLEGKNIGNEVERIFKIGRVTPSQWMKVAIGNDLSAVPLLNSTTVAVEKIKEFDKQNKKSPKNK